MRFDDRGNIIACQYCTRFKRHHSDTLDGICTRLPQKMQIYGVVTTTHDCQHFTRTPSEKMPVREVLALGYC